jgi:hypothetical protein
MARHISGTFKGPYEPVVLTSKEAVQILGELRAVTVLGGYPFAEGRLRQLNRSK